MLKLLLISTLALNAQGLLFVPITPCRLVDTRGASIGFDGVAPFNGPSIPAGTTVAFPVQSATEAKANTAPSPCGAIPATALAYDFTVTVDPVVPTTARVAPVDFLTIWPSGAPKPVTVVLTDQQGIIMTGHVTVAAGLPSGGVNVYNPGPSATDVVVDMNGYFVTPPVLPSFPITITPTTVTLGTGAVQSAANGVTVVPGPFTITSSVVPTDVGDVQVGANASNQAVCYLVGLSMVDATGLTHFGATGFAGNTCAPGPDTNTGDWITLIPVVAGQFQNTGPQYAPVPAFLSTNQ